MFRILRCNCGEVKLKYGRTSMARILMVRLPCLTRTHSWGHMFPHMRLLWSNFCIYITMLSFTFSISSDRRSLKWKWKLQYENSDRRSPIYRTRVSGVQSINIETYPGWLELPLTGNNFNGPKPVRATEVLFYNGAMGNWPLNACLPWFSVFNLNRTHYMVMLYRKY